MLSSVRINTQQYTIPRQHAHINSHPYVANNTLPRKRRCLFSSIYNLLFGPAESQDVKQLKKNVAILMQKPKPTTLIGTNAQTNNNIHFN